MKGNIVLRDGKIEDAAPLLKMLNSADELQVNEKGGAYTKDWISDALLDKKRNLTIIVEDCGKIAGFLIAEIWKNKRYSFLNDIYINPNHRKGGIATRLMNEYEKRLKKLKINSIIELVLTTNETMHKFSEKSGFKKGNTFYIYEKKLI